MLAPGNLFFALMVWAPALALTGTIPCTHDERPAQLHNWRITCEAYTIDNDQPGVHYDHTVIHQHGFCQEA